MTLLRQLTLATLGLLLLVVAGSFAISVHNTRAYLETQLGTHAQDAATSLGLTLTTAAGADDRVMLESLVDATFDRGYYSSIEVSDAQGAPLLARRMELTPPAVPVWFVRLLPLTTPPGSATIMDGWRQLGTVTVRSHPGQAYVELWRTTRDSLRLFALAGLLAIASAWLLVRTILRPLRAVEAQARAVAEREFTVQTRMPRTPDLRRVVEAMNHMATKVRQMLDEQLELTEHARAQAYRDPVTGLANRTRFDNELAQLVTAPEEHFAGALALVQVHALADYNARHGYAAGDALLAAAAQRLERAAEPFGLRCAARLGGGDFALLVGEAGPEAPARLGTALVRALSELHQAGVAPDPKVGHAGVAVFRRSESGRTLLARADRALRQAQRDAAEGYALADAGPALGAQDTARLLSEALAQHRLVLHVQGVHRLDSGGGVLHHEVLARIETPDGLLPAGAFLPAAERQGLAIALDRHVLGLLLASSDGAGGPPLAVNLSPASAGDAEFRGWFVAELAQRPNLAHRLSLELPEYGAVQRLDDLRTLTRAVRPLGVSMGLDHFGRGFSPFGYLASLRPAYLKVDGSHVRGLPHSEEGRFFLRALKDVAHALDGLLIAESVEHEAERSALENLGVDAVQGYHVAAPVPLTTLAG